MTSGAVAKATVAAPPSTAFPAVTRVDPTAFYPRFGPLPAVVGVEGQSGEWDAVGQTRVLRLSDGGSVRETLETVDDPSRFAYRLTGFTGPFGRIVAEAFADWRFRSRGSHTDVEWSYAFTPRRGFGILVALIVRLAWAPYMRRVLPAIAEAAAARGAGG